MQRVWIGERSPSGGFSSVCPAANGPLAPEDEGLSYVSLSEDKEDKILFKDFIAELKEEIIGKALYDEYGTFPMYAKFFDNKGPFVPPYPSGGGDRPRGGQPPEAGGLLFPRPR